MRLNKEEYLKYLEIHSSLIYYVGKREGFLGTEIGFEEFMEMNVQDKFEIRNSLYTNTDNFDAYIEDNRKKLSKEDVAIIQEFKNFKTGIFYVMKYLKKYTLFFSDKYIYGVYALSDFLEDLLGNELPHVVEAVLLPYKNKIIYDGILNGYPIRLGKGMMKSIKSDFLLSKRKYGIIEDLPVKVEIDIKTELIAMMNSRSSLNKYWDEIDYLLDENPELTPVYYRELGRINSKIKKKELNRIGIKDVFYAIHNQTLIASGANQSELDKRINILIKDKTRLEALYIFKS